ncbi:MAG: prepilin-type N-terminal cleavage/methylation domain-containing protein [Cytophagales bacterium]|nr:prepilin-type N-terminal cleavage/methylation domain-containing protein [Cytophagales bacterium]
MTNTISMTKTNTSVSTFPSTKLSTKPSPSLQAMRRAKLAMQLKQRGFTLIETLVSLALVMAIGIAGTYQTVQDGYDRVAEGVGQQAYALANTLSSYTDYNRPLLLDGATTSATVQGPRGTGVVANKMFPTLAELTALGYFPAVPGNPPMGGSWLYSLTPEPAGCLGDACVIQRRVWLSQQVKTGGALDVDRAAIIARAAGGMAAFSRSDNSGQVRGIAGNWLEANPLGTKAGAVMLSSASPTSALDAYMPRSGSRAMVGALNMGGQNVNAANNVAAAGNVNAGGTVSAPNITTNGGLATITSSNGDKMYLQTLPGGKFRMVDGAWTKELFTVDQSGNLSTLNTVIQPTGVLTTAGQINANGGVVKIAAVAYSGWGCSQGNGAVTTDPTGAVLSCQNGTWTASSGDGASGTHCGSVNRDWGGGWANYVQCKGQNLIGGNTTYSWVPSSCYDSGYGTVCSGGYWSSSTSYYSNCPSGYTFRMTAHTNWGGVSGDDVFSCIKN